MKNLSLFLHACVFIIISIPALANIPNDPLPSWNEGPAKKAILDFVEVSIDKQNPNYVPPEERIATFDQDGTLWVEQPIYTQVIFAFDMVVELAAKHPEWKNQAPFKSLIEKNKAEIAQFSLKDLEKIIMVTHTGMSVEAFQMIVKEWIEKTKKSALESSLY